MTSLSEKSKIIDSIDSITNNRTTIKYGDSDVVSKRRKDDAAIYYNNSCSSPTKTVYSSPVKTICHHNCDDYSQFEKPILKNSHNSTFNQEDQQYQNTNNDFKGGLINNNSDKCDKDVDKALTSDIFLKSVGSQTNFSSFLQLESRLCYNDTSIPQSSKCQKMPSSSNIYISKSPSGTSCGFENTFRILENQIKSKKFKHSLNNISSLAHCSNNTTYLNRISEEILNDDDFIDSLESSNEKNDTLLLFKPIKKYNTLISNEEEVDEDYQPTFFELKLEAMQRVNELSKTSSKPEIIKRLNPNINDDDDDDDGERCCEDVIDSSNSIGSKNSIAAPINETLYGFKSFPLKLNNSKIQESNHGNEIDLQENTILKNCMTSSNTEYCDKIDENNEGNTIVVTTATTCCTSTNNAVKETLLEFSDDRPDIAYHIARGKDGKKYLKIVKNLLLDKVLCGNRVSQMTRAYDDIEAVTRLLEEKEKDLELTVQIGKELLTQNNRLENRITELEQELKSSNEDRAQLVHDLHQKNELISVLTNDVDDGSETETPTLSKSITLDLLQKKISSLQDENKTLKVEASQLVKQTDEVEEQERRLMEDITSQLNSAHTNYDGLSLELERQKEENRLQHEQIVSLTARLAEAEMRLHQLTAENDEQVSLLSITKENQNLLASELAEFKQRYQEVLALLQEAQEYMRKNRKKQQPHARSSFIPGLGSIAQPDSLHLELMESSMYSENSLDSGIGVENRISNLGINSRVNLPSGVGSGGSIPAYKKIFETVQCAAKNGNYSDSMSHLSTMSLSSSSGPRMSTMPYTGYNSNPAGSYHRPSSVYSGSTYPSYDSSSMGLKTMSCESLSSQSDDGYPQQSSGVPGAPGAKDLEAALKRLTPGEVLARRAMLSHAPAGTYNYDETYTRTGGIALGIRTPDSIMSTGSSRLSNMSDSSISERSHSTSNHWRLPEKLQIVKPMEGSQTLGHWSRLATPTLSGLLEERPGVTIRGGRGLDDLGLTLYSLSDVEEDVDDFPPGKQFQDSGYTYTFTTSHVMHPDDGLVNDLSFLSQSQLSSRMASTSTSRQPSCPQTPRTDLSRRNSCSTYSVNMGLASMLNERGIKAVTPSAINTPAGPNFSPTVTPCNSPEGSPTRSMSPEPLFGLLSTGADLIRRKLIGDYDRPTQHQHRISVQNKQQKIMLSRLEKRALRSLRLLEKVESVGLENIIATQPSAMSQLASGIASRSASPMAQLTSLKNLQAANNGMVDDLQFDRNQIRAVLHKGLSNDSLKSLDDNSSGTDSNTSDNQLNIDAQLENKFETALTTPTEPAPVTLMSSSPIALNKEDELQTSIAQNSNISGNNSSTDIRLKQLQRQKSRRNLKNGQRPDLGTVGGRIRPDLGKVEQRNSNNNGGSEVFSRTGTLERNPSNQNKPHSIVNDIIDEPPQQSMTQSFVGSISSLFFGRKGGWL